MAVISTRSENKKAFFGRLSILLIAAITFFVPFCIFSCGGGGGGGSAVAFGNNSGSHNGGDAGGWGNGGYNGNGFGGSSGIGSGNEGEVIITGGTPLNVTKYVYNGTEYSDVTALTTALSAADALPDSFNIDFYVDGEGTPRTARVTANGKAGNGEDIFIEHQYKALFPNDSSGIQEVFFYKRDGITLPGDPAGTEENGFIFETNWNIGSSHYPCGSTIDVASAGDMDFSTATTETAPYGFKEDAGDYILGFRSSPPPTGTITINTNKVIKQVKLPESGDAVLDLSTVSFKNNEIQSTSWDGNGTIKGVILPSTVTTIGSAAFQYNFGSALETVTIPSSVTTIGTYAFKGLSNLQTVNLSGNALTSIGNEAFYSCSSLRAFEMPDSVTTLGANAFYGCSDLATLTLSNHLTEIPNSACYGCSSLNSTLEIPASVTAIGNSAFQDCSSIDTLTLHPGLTTIGDNAFQGCSDLDAVSIPNGVTSIGNAAFLSCSDLAQISIPPSVSSIGNSAFNGVKVNCDLTINNTGTPIALGGPLALPNQAFYLHLTGTHVPQDADTSFSLFYNNTKLIGAEIGSNVTSLAGAFRDCTNLVEVTFANPPNITAISSNAFCGCSNLPSIELPSTITSIGNDAFNGCSRLASINIPSGVTSIGPDALKDVGNIVSGGCTITFEGSQTMTQCRLPNRAFKVVLKNGVPQYISGGAPESIFKDDDLLTSVSYEGGSNLIANAFMGCSLLTTVTFKSYPTIIQNSPTPPLPDNVTRIIFEQGDYSPLGIGGSNNSSSNSVNKLFSPTRDYNTLYVTFMNDTSKADITVREGAFNFSAAVNIHYEFNSYPNAAMTYDAENCFRTGAGTLFNSTNFTWNASAKEWRQ